MIGAIVILGTGAGIAFFMLMAHRSRDAAFIARTAETVVIADMLFTLTAVLLQPVSGGALMWLSSTNWSERWLMTSLGLYAVAGLFWVPVIFMQIEMRDLAALRSSVTDDASHRLGCTASGTRANLYFLTQITRTTDALASVDPPAALTPLAFRKSRNVSAVTSTACAAAAPFVGPAI